MDKEQNLKVLFNYEDELRQTQLDLDIRKIGGAFTHKDDPIYKKAIELSVECVATPDEVYKCLIAFSINSEIKDIDFIAKQIKNTLNQGVKIKMKNRPSKTQ